MDESLKPSNEISLREYLDLLRRRKGIIINTFVVVLVVGIVVTFMTRPTYRTSARILVEGKSFTLAQVNANDPLSNIFIPDTGHNISTQIEVIQSEKVLSDAYKDAQVPADSVHVEVKEVGDTDVLEITTESENAGFAEKLAQALPKTYLNYVGDNRKAEINKALDFAEARQREETTTLRLAEQELQRLRRLSSIYSVTEERKARITEAAAAESDLHKAEAVVAGDQALLDALVAGRKTIPSAIESPTVTTNPRIEELKDDLTKLENARAGLLPLFKPTHPKVQALDAQIEDLNAKLTAAPATRTTVTQAPNPAIGGYDADIRRARTSLAASKATLARALARRAQAAAKLNSFGTYETRQAELESEVERRRAAITMFAEDAEHLSLRQMAIHEPVKLVASAGPAVQVAPKKLNNMVYAAIAGLLLGLCFALLYEYLDDRINVPEDARRVFDAPVLGYVPLIENEAARLLSQTHGGGSVLESYRVLRSNVQFAAVDTPTTSILVTSTVPGEGKSVNAANLAVAMALDGRSVILVDADLRRPTLHTEFDMEQRPGLTNVLVGHTPLDQALKQTGIPGLRVLTSGPLPPNPAELLNSHAFRQIHAELKERAEIVIFDSPPVLATADAQVLAAEVDGVLYVLQFGEARKSAVRHVSELMRQAHARVLGLVFNKVDLANRRDGYYYGYYRYYDYYQSPQLEDGSSRRRPSTNEFETLLPGNGRDSTVATGPRDEEDEG